MSVFKLLGGLILLVSGQVLSQPMYQYFTPGDTTCIKCLTDADRVTWNGPAFSDTVDNAYNVSNIYGEINEWETTVYGNNNKTNSDLPHTSRLELQNMDGTFTLTIVNTSQEDEGLYVCEAATEGENVNVTFILLQKRRRVSNITFQHKTGGMLLTGREHQPVIINCIEDTALPPSHLSLLENGEILVRNAIGHINYTIIPTRDDVNTTFRCTLTNSYWNTTISKDVVVQFTPLVKFNKTFEAVEGKGSTLCCSAEGNPMVKDMKILHDEIPVPTTRNGDTICHFSQNLTRTKAGNYVCFATNDNGKANASAEITIMSEPGITDKSSSTVIAVVVLCLLSFLSVSVTVLFIVKKRHSQSGSADVSLEMEGEVIPVENRLYSAIQNGQSPNNEANPSPGSTLLSVEAAVISDRSVHSTLSHTTEELGQSVENRLNYADVVFDARTTNQNRIIGNAQEEEITVYADVDPALVGRLPDPSSSSSSSDDDFMYLHGIENYIGRRGELIL